MVYYYVSRNNIVRKRKMPCLTDVLNGTAEDSDYAKEVYRKGYSTTTKCSKTMEKADKETNLNFNKLENLAAYGISKDYKEYKIPKKSGGYRTLHEPNPYLKNYQKRYAAALYKVMNGAVSHTNAFAYVPYRSCKQAIERHKGNKSKWFLKLDIHDFFGSTTCAFAEQMLARVYPFCTYRYGLPWLRYCFMETEDCRSVLPQGAPSSPILSNLIMIPIDYEITKRMRNMDLVYTRYCDDILISGKQKFDWKIVVEQIKEVLRMFDAPYELNEKKTRFGSNKGRNWNLGLMYNKDDQITIGHKKKKLFKAQLVDMITHDSSDDYLYKMAGIVSYYKSIEPEYISYVIKKYSEKFDIDIEYLLKEHKVRKMNVEE